MDNIDDYKGGFVPGMPKKFTTRLRDTGTSYLTGLGQEGAKRVLSGENPESVAREIFERERQKGADAINNIDVFNLLTTLNSIVSAENNSASGGGTGEIEFNKPSSPRGFNGFYIDYSPNPISVSLNTGLKPNCYGVTYEDTLYGFAGAEAWSPLHINLCKLRIPTAGTELKSFFDTVIGFQFSNALQRSVSFSLDISKVTGANLLNSMNTLLEALQLYLFIDSILTYSSNPLNKNEAFLDMRSQINPAAMNELSKLKYILAGTPIPPNMRLLCYWFMQTYRYSDSPASSLIMNCPFDLSRPYLEVKGMQIGEFLQVKLVDAITAMNSRRDTFSLIGRACPGWVTGTVDSSNAMALYDPNFTTFFANCPLNAAYASVAYRYPTVSDSPCVYGSFTNSLDGFVYSLHSFWNDGYWLPSMLDLSLTSTDGYNCTSNKFSYSAVDEGFVTTCKNLNLENMRGDSYSLNTSAAVSYLYANIPAGAQPVLGVTVNAVTQTAINAVEWLMSSETIGRGSSSTKSYKPKRRRK